MRQVVDTRDDVVLFASRIQSKLKYEENFIFRYMMHIISQWG